MRRLLLVVLLCSFAGSALALFPVRTDWEQNHLQGKVKSVESYSEDNPEAIEEGDPLTNYKKSFYNAQGFLVKEEERDTEESYNQSTRFHMYHYDDKNRLIERNSEEVVFSTENKDDLHLILERSINIRKMMMGRGYRKSWFMFIKNRCHRIGKMDIIK